MHMDAMVAWESDMEGQGSGPIACTPIAGLLTIASKTRITEGWTLAHATRLHSNRL
jgi:hypothetical protein